MPWWVWMIVGFFLASRVLRRARMRGRYRHMNPWLHGTWGTVMISRSHRCGQARHHGHRAHWREAPQPQAAQPPVELTPAQKREQAMSELRRRYVADEISVEEYERELDRLLRE
jgi:hypothetical protein